MPSKTHIISKLKKLIVVSQSLSDEEKEHFLTSLPNLTEEELISLGKVFLKEKKERTEIRKEKTSLYRNYLLRLKSFTAKAKKILLKKREKYTKSAEKKEMQSFESALDSL